MTMITPSYLGETIEYSSLHACRSTLEDPTNMAPGIAELTGGNPARMSSSGGADNTAQFSMIGKQHGSFVVSIRLLPTQSAPRP